MNNGVRRSIQELNLTDRFLFAENMDEPEAYEVAARSGSARIKLIHSRVEKVRHSEKCGVKYMQRWEEIAYARQDGYEAGALREVLAAVCKKLAKGKGEEQIAEELEKTPEEIHWICEVARKYAPAYNQDTIYQELRA
ncbi:MAG: hypothetical protein HDR02_04830 [Lachnospiraceae bacterium]|nr:hypothetical protein [Lachnospiraceae bacterium]